VQVVILFHQHIRSTAQCTFAEAQPLVVYIPAQPLCAMEAEVLYAITPDNDMPGLNARIVVHL
jgi:hypothetical protein